MATIRSEDSMKAKIGILSEELARKRMIRIAEEKVMYEESYRALGFDSVDALSQVSSSENVELAEVSGHSIGL